MQKIKLGVCGLGMAWERLHKPALERLRDKFEITAVCDRDIIRANNVAKELNIEGKAYGDWSSMIANADIEAVDLMLPIQENFESAKEVLKNRKHLIAEKPFAATVEGAKQLVKIARDSGVKVLIAENIRYNEESVLIKSIIEERKIGNVAYFIDNHITEFQADMLSDTFAKAEWRKHPEFKGGAFLDSAIHYVARMRFLFGDALNIFASGRPSEVDFSPYSCINVMFTFKDHIAGFLSHFLIAKETQLPLVGLRIFGTNGEIYLEDKNCGFVNVSYKNGDSEAIPYNPGEGYYHELDNFYKAVRENEEIVSTPEKELGDIQLIFDILESIEKGKSVRASNKYKTKEK
ncbi:MAG: Gfo/Idh/MocA family oxidoreductase [Defluviitaleaceae bacterium]|nr:Gfo/Idh/MocA family oxidoreductase [Defluviitaleaceae bacterium]